MAYQYKESGLDNIWLENGYTIHETPYGEGVSIENTEGLHQAIGEWIIQLPKPLTGAELRFLRLEMELTQRDLSGILGVDEQTVRRYEKGRTKAVSGPADRLLRALYNEFVSGDGSVRSMVNRLANLNVVEHETGRFCETPRGWQPHGCDTAA